MSGGQEVHLVGVLTVFGLAMVELWAAIPAGFVLRLHPLLVGTVAAFGAVVGAVIVLVVGERVRAWLLRGRGGGEGGNEGRIYRIWARYGVVGLGLLAPLVTGALLGTVLGVALGAPRRRLLLWMCAGIVLWSAALTLASALGLAGFQALRH